MGKCYQTSARLARRRVEIRYDPEVLEQVEVWLDDTFQERVRPFEVQTHRRPRDPSLVSPSKAPEKPTADWLSHLVERRREKGFDEPPPRQHIEDKTRQRVEADTAIVDLLREHLDDAVIDEQSVRGYLDRFGPFDLEQARIVVEGLLANGLPDDIHITVVLEAIREDAQRKAES